MAAGRRESSQRHTLGSHGVVGIGPSAVYTHPMRSVADELHRDTQARVLALPMMARIELALQLGDEDAALYAAHARLAPDEARRRLRAQRANGRPISRAARLDGR